MRRPLPHDVNRVDSRDWVLLGLALVCVLLMWVVHERQAQEMPTEVCVYHGRDVQCVEADYWAVSTQGDLWVYREVVESEEVEYDMAVAAWKHGSWDKVVKGR
jgi:hypothetical protein